MAKVPVVVQHSWFSLIIHVCIIFLLIFLFNIANIEQSVIYGPITYLVAAFTLRNFVPIDERRGIRILKKGKYEEAIPYFEKSVDFFTRKKWIDQYRYITLLSASGMTYREMGLCNIAFCYSQTGRGLKAKEYYEIVLKEYPKNGIAIAALNMLNASGT